MMAAALAGASALRGVSARTRACLAALACGTLHKGRAGWAHAGDHDVIAWPQSIVQALRRRGLCTIRERRKRHYEATLTRAGQAAVAADLALTRLPRAGDHPELFPQGATP